MQRNKRQGILMSAGVLGIGAVLGFSTVASADDRNNGRNKGHNDVKNDRRDDQRDNRRDNRDDRWDNRRDDRRDDHRDNRNHDKHDKSGKQNNGNHYGHQKQQQRPDWNRGQAPVYRPQYNPPVHNPQYNPGYNPGYNPQYNPGYGTNPQYNNGGWSQQNVTIEGTVISDGRGNGFTLRTANGQTWLVQVQGVEPAGLSRGDVVRVFGPTRSNTVLATGMRILQNR